MSQSWPVRLVEFIRKQMVVHHNFLARSIDACIILVVVL